MTEIIHTQEYDRWSFDPPMPVLDIDLSRPGGQTFSAAVAAVIDTGADGTLIPIDLLELIDAPQVDRAYLRGITGDRQPVDLYLVTIRVATVIIHGVRAVALPSGETTILGRDVLNQLHLALVGTAGVTEVLL